MTPSEQITRPVYVPTLLAAGCSPAMVARCLLAAAGTGLTVRICAADEALAEVGMRRPLVIAVPSAVRALHAEELDRVACSADAILVELDDQISERAVHALLEGALRARFGRRERRPDAGVYSFIGGGQVDVPLSSRPPAPADGPGLARGSVPPRSGGRLKLHSDIDALFDGYLFADALGARRSRAR